MNAKEHDAPQDRTPPDPELVDQLCAYLEHVIRKAEEPPVYLGKHRVLDLYVQPDVYRSATADVVDEDADEQAADKEGPKNEPQRVPWESECELARHAAIPWRAAVLGPPGQGKSLLLMTLARRLALDGLEALRTPSPELDKVPLPVVVPLNDLANVARKRETEEPWDRVLRRALGRVLHGQCPTPGAWSKAIKHIVQRAENEAVWLLLDGLDEVPRPGPLIEMLETLENWRCHVLVSSRQHAYEAIKLSFRVTEYHLTPFSPWQIEVFLRAWLPDPERQQKVRSLLKPDSSIAHMATNPLLLALLCGYEERHGVPGEITRSEIYEGVLRDLLGLDIDKRSTIDHERAEEWLPLLTDLMWKLFWKDGGRPIATGELLAFIAHNDNRPTPLGTAVAELAKMHPRQQAEELLQELRTKGILVPTDGKKSAYTMLHRSFTEYLAARALAGGIEGSQTVMIGGVRATPGGLWHVLDKKAWLPQWENVVLFVAGQLQDPKPLLAKLSAAEDDDYFRHRLALAALCIGQIPVQSRAGCADLAKRVASDYFDYWYSILRDEVVHPRDLPNRREALRQVIQIDSGFYSLAEVASSSSALRAACLKRSGLMKRGLRFFDEGSGPDGEVYRAQTVDELSHVIPGLLKGPPAPAVTQPARGDKSPEDVAAEPPAQTPKPWKPTKATWHVIRLMQQGKSNDEIAAMENVKVEKSAANLRKIRERARRNDYLTRLKSRET